MKKETAKYWWIFIGFVLFGGGIISGINSTNEGLVYALAEWTLPFLGAAFIAWGLSHY